MPEPQHTLLPRTRGFVATVQGLRSRLDAVYDVTDTLPRISVVTPSGYEIEQIRPRAWAVCVGHLRARWMRGNFATPRASTIKRWCLTNPTVIKRLSSVNQEASWYN